MSRTWLLIRNGNIVDGVSDNVLRDHDILVGGDRIVRIARTIDPEEHVPRGEPCEFLDARGKYVMPGLIDAHCHMTYGESLAQEEQDLYTGVETRTLIAAANLRKVLRAGVTSISQPGGSYYIGVGLREGIRSGLVDGPRMQTAGRYLTTSNGLTDWYPDSVGVPDGSIGVLTNTSAEMVSEVRHQVKNGVDLIKLADSPFGEYQAFTDDEMKIVTDLAHQLGRKVTIHARGSAEVRAAVRARVDWIMHGNTMTGEVIAELADSSIPLVPTLLLLANMADFGDRVGVATKTRDNVRRLLDRTAETLHAAHDAGVTFLTGTDTGFAVTPYGEWHARELELLMTYAGLSAQEAIESATSGSATVFGLSGELGVVAEGAIADLLVVAANPLRDVRVLQRVDGVVRVIKGGRPLVFDDRDDIRWNHQRSKVLSTGTLTRALVADDQPRLNTPDGETASVDADHARDLHQTLERHQRDSSTPID